MLSDSKSILKNPHDEQRPIADEEEKFIVNNSGS